VEDGISIVNEVGDIAVVIYSVKRDGDKLVMDGKALGTMRMDMILSAAEAFRGLRIALSWPCISFVLLMPYFWITNGIRGLRDKT
jgi:hypothetical protein